MSEFEYISSNGMPCSEGECIYLQGEDVVISDWVKRMFRHLQNIEI